MYIDSTGGGRPTTMIASRERMRDGKGLGGPLESELWWLIGKFKVSDS